MTVVRVNPASVQAYGADAQDRFNQIRTELGGQASLPLNLPPRLAAGG